MFIDTYRLNCHKKISIEYKNHPYLETKIRGGDLLGSHPKRTLRNTRPVAHCVEGKDELGFVGCRTPRFLTESCRTRTFRAPAIVNVSLCLVFQCAPPPTPYFSQKCTILGANTKYQMRLPSFKKYVATIENGIRSNPNTCSTFSRSNYQ